MMHESRADSARGGTHFPLENKLYVCLYSKVHTVKNKRCACTARARGPFMEAAHDSVVRNSISNLTVVCRLRESQQQTDCNCT